MKNLDTLSILDQKHLLIEGGHGEAPGVIAMIEEYLRHFKAPGVRWYQTSLSTGILKGITGLRQGFLVVDFDKAPEHHVLVSAADFGNGLRISQYLVASPCIGRDTRRALRLFDDPTGRHELGAELNLFEMEDLIAWTTMTRFALRHAVSILTKAKDGTLGDHESAASLPEEDSPWTSSLS